MKHEINRRTIVLTVNVITAAPVLYLLIALLIPPRPGAEPEKFLTLHRAFLLTSFLFIALSRWVENLLLKPPPGGKFLPPGKVYRAVIVSAALGESISVFGVILVLLGFSIETFLHFFALSVLYFGDFRVLRFGNILEKLPPDTDRG
ncbi:MAG: hypothetical protein AB1742_05415 [bacterium]